MVTPRQFVPDAGDVVWLHFSPQAGHEQAGHRPAVVLSPSSYNAKAGLMLCCPVTTQVKNYPFEVAMDDGRGGAILSDQVKSIDWRARKAAHKGRVADSTLAEVRAKVRALIG